MYAITETYSVSPQIGPEDVAAIKAAGFTTLICNRPDDEVPPGLRAADFEALALAEGLAFVVVPVSHYGLTLDIVAQHGAAVTGASGPVLAYCNSGNRSTMIWPLAMAHAGTVSPDEIAAVTRNAGFDMSGMRPTLDALWQQAQAKGQE